MWSKCPRRRGKFFHFQSILPLMACFEHFIQKKKNVHFIQKN